jgi:hypothetical protein
LGFYDSGSDGFNEAPLVVNIFNPAASESAGKSLPGKNHRCCNRAVLSKGHSSFTSPTQRPSRASPSAGGSYDSPEDDLVGGFRQFTTVAAMKFSCAAIVYDERICKFISSRAARPASP